MPRRFRKCILHIGAEKTGSTTLQVFLHLNRAAFLSAGYFIPKTLSPHTAVANHEYLTTYALQDKKLNDDCRCRAGLYTVTDVRNHRLTIDDNIIEEIRDLGVDSLDSMVLLLSNEHCQSRLVEKEEILALREFLEKLADNIEIVCYLRPQHDVCVSLFDTALKAGHCDIDLLPDFTSSRGIWVSEEYFHFSELLLRWSSCFGPSNLTVRLFGKAELCGGSIIDDFLSVIGCKLHSVIRPPNMNFSLDKYCQSVLNAINRAVRTGINGISGAKRAALIGLLERVSKGTSLKPHRTAAMKFFDQFAQDNELIRKQYFPSRSTLFSVDFSSYPENDVTLPPEDLAMLLVLARTQEILE